MSLVTMTVYANSPVFCHIVSCLQGNIKYQFGENIAVSLKKTRKYPHEIQVPIQIIGQFVKKNHTTIDLYQLQRLNKETKLAL